MSENPVDNQALPENNQPDNPSNPTVQQAEVLGICAFSLCTEQNTQKCRKCQRHFCIMHANRFSPNFCKECFSNLALIESKFTRTFEDFDVKKDKFIVHKESCAQYYMDGPDWPFLNAWIDTMSDDELRSIWNFHFFVMKTIEAENETRRIENAQKARMQGSQKLITSTTKVASTTVKVTKQADTAEDVIKKLKKQGLPDVIIDQMIAAMGLKKGA